MAFTVIHQNVFPIGYDNMELIVINSSSLDGVIPLKINSPASVICGEFWVNGNNSAHSVMTATVDPETRTLLYYECRPGSSNLFQCFLVMGV